MKIKGIFTRNFISYLKMFFVKYLYQLFYSNKKASLLYGSTIVYSKIALPFVFSVSCIPYSVIAMSISISPIFSRVKGTHMVFTPFVDTAMSLPTNIVGGVISIFIPVL